ncbi:LysR family transcriptional regulator [bacterium 1XD42-54]|jgi:DNA-binding transcriptional LysR family regulator|nr:LysR family transcriptional regulator [bacterium 1XD42-54]
MQMFGHNEYVYAVYKEGSFSKAAEKLHISQPALSAIILKEEEEIGCPIFDRRKRPIELTAFGTEYIRSIGKIYAIEKELSDYITSAKTLESGEVTLCGTNLGLLYKVPVVIAKFKQQYPNITVHVAESCTRGSIQQLNSAEVDLVLTSKPLDSHRYVQEVCYQERLILAIPRCFPVNEELTAKKRFSYEELQQMPYHISKEEMVSLSKLGDTSFILLRNTNYLRECTDLLFREAYISPPIVMEVDQSAISYNFCSLGMGATILSNRLIEPSPKNDSLYFYAIDSRFTARETYIAYNKNRYVTFAMKKLIEMMTTEE